MQQTPFGKKEKNEIEAYLRGYSLNRRLLGIEKYHQCYFTDKERYLDSIDHDMLNEAPLARARMFGIRHFILGLDNCDEKLFLYYHYIKGESVERCSELLGISRRSGFRMKQRALILAYAKYSVAASS